MTLPVLYRPTPPTVDTDIGISLDGWAAGTHQDDILDSQGTEWWLYSDGLEGWNGAPDVRLGGVDRQQDHGQTDAASFYGARIITVRGVAICVSKTAALLAQDIITSVAAWDPAPLYLLRVSEPGRPTRRAMVRLNAPTRVGAFNGHAFDWQLQLKAPDPRRYDDTEQSVTLSPPTGADGGVTLPATVPVTLSTSGLSTSSAVVTNDGTIAVRPTVVLTGPLVDPQIAHVGAGRSLSMTVTLAADDTLTLDFDKRTILLNGSASRASTLTESAAWWELAPGGNDVAFTAGGGSGTAVISWRSGWL
jgi:hypothetical protein